MHSIFARSKEQELLKRLYTSEKSEFLAVYGRRRVGKTFLIREYFKYKGTYFALTGIKNSSVRKQLKNFFAEFERVFGVSPDVNIPKDWFEAFALLRKAIEKEQRSERIIIFIDELPWLATPRSGFLQDLDHFWNRYMSGDPRILLIVCGSAASWMIKHVIHDKGGLHGRLTAEIRLLPFDLKETEEFLKFQGVVLNRKSIIDIYMAIGGIPKYLTYVQKGRSAIQVIGDLCFNGPLVDEFRELYASLFDHYNRHISVVKALSMHPCGLTKTEISKHTELTVGGGMNTILDELEESGFILEIKSYGKLKKESRFKLIDEYSLFYLKWASKAKENNLKMRDDQFWMHVFNSPRGYSWAGYAFETLCFKHLANIKNALGISSVLTSASGWVHKVSKGSEDRGAQIDLLIDRADNCINLCEMKYSNEEFEITKSVDQELRDKKSIFITQTKTKKSVFITMISPYGIKKNSGYFETVDMTLTMDDLF